MSTIPYGGQLDKIQSLVNRLYGHNLIPIRLRASSDPQERKAPVVDDWPRVLSAPCDWQEGEGIGLRTGKQLDDTYTYVIDLDYKPDKGVDAAIELEKLQRKLPPEIESRLPLAYSTNWNGRYLLMRSTVEYRKRRIKDEDGRVIGDFLGEGAQVVLPTPDRMIRGSLANIPMLTDDEMHAVAEAIGITEPEHPAMPITRTVCRPDGTLRPGDDFTQRGSIEPYLVQAGWRLVYRKGDVSYWRRPGKHTGISASLNFYPGIFYVFSTSADPFEADTAYTLFRAYHTLVHGGDWRAAVRDLAQQGYGTPRAKRETSGVNGRPHVVTLDRYLDVLREHQDEDGRVNMTQKELAAFFDVSQPTIRRLDAAAKQRGLGERVPSPPAQTSYFQVFTPSDQNLPTYTYGDISETSEVDQTHAREEPPEDQPCSTCGTPGLVVDESGAWACNACQTTLDAHQLIADALDLYDGLRGGPRKRDAVHRYVASNGRPDLDPERLDELITQVAAVRRQIRQDKALRAKLRAMKDRRLGRHIRGLSVRYEDARKEGNHAQAAVYARLASIAQDEYERREPLRKVLGKGDLTPMLEAMCL